MLTLAQVQARAVSGVPLTFAEAEPLVKYCAERCTTIYDEMNAAKARLRLLNAELVWLNEMRDALAEAMGVKNDR